MTTLVTPVTPEEERKNFEEFFASFLKCPHPEEPIEETISEQLASRKENAVNHDECIMPNEKQIHLKHRKRKAREKKQNLRGLAKTRSILAKRTKSKIIAKKQEETKHFLQSMEKEALYIENMNEYTLPISAVKASNNLFSTFDEFQSEGFPLKEKMDFKKRQTAGVLRITLRGDFLFVKKLQKINEKLIFEVYNV